MLRTRRFRAAGAGSGTKIVQGRREGFPFTPRCKDTNKRGQKQARLHFAERKYLRRKSKIRISRVQKQILFAFCRGGVSKTKSKIEISREKKASELAFFEAKVFKEQSKIQIDECNAEFIRILPSGVSAAKPTNRNEQPAEASPPAFCRAGGYENSQQQPAGTAIFRRARRPKSAESKNIVTFAWE